MDFVDVLEQGAIRTQKAPRLLKPLPVEGTWENKRRAVGYLAQISKEKIHFTDQAD
jgi:hypothetical protein